MLNAPSYMGIIGTTVAVSAGTSLAGRSAQYRAAKLAISRHNATQPQITELLAWFDALPDGDAWQYASTVLGTSRGSRFADREALINRIRSQAF